MPQFDRRYQIVIKAAHVPENLKGAPMWVEIIPQTGKVQRTSLTLSDEMAPQAVDRPGQYLVRAMLPSGELVADVATISDQPDQDGVALGEASLDFGEYGAEGPGLAVHDPSSEKGHSFRKAISNVGTVIKGILRNATGEVGENRFDWGTFERWTFDHGGDAQSDIPTAVVRHGGYGPIGLDGHIAAPPSNRSRQLLIMTRPGPGKEEALIAWRPERANQSAAITADPDAAANRSGSPCLASGEHPDPITGTLFSYIRAGALNQARQGVVALTALLDQPGAADRIGSDGAALAAYVLYKLRRPEAGRTISLLVNKFPDVADLHVLQGSQLLSEGKSQDAGKHFKAAVSCGVPSYTEGVRLLRDGLNYLRELYPLDTGIRANTRIANGLASAANFNSELTCLRLGRDVAAEFIRD